MSIDVVIPPRRADSSAIPALICDTAVTSSETADIVGVIVVVVVVVVVIVVVVVVV